ncbi:MAG: bb3-type cytochrome oxidase subunit IV, partial [Pelagibacteraceae bacterium]|nr:bb3-type cytochrome oxidase subunit IV [Pelagibacteraceae bacterium]
MDQTSLDKLPKGFKSIGSDFGTDQTAFKGVNWGKAMMWIFLLSDTFIFSCFLISYMKGRASTVVEWPNPSEVFALNFMGVPVPLLLIAIMTFVLITSSGTMALAVKYGYERNKKMCGWFILFTALG